MSRIVIAATAAAGHAYPLLDIAAGLDARGHQVTVLTGAAFEPAARDRGLRLAPLPAAGQLDLDGDYLARKARVSSGLAKLNFDLANGFGAVIPAQHAALQELLDGGDAALVYDAFFLGAWPILLGAPGIRPTRSVGVGISPLQLASDDTSSLGPAPGRPEESRPVNRAANQQLRTALADGQAEIERMVRACGASQPVPFLFDGVVTVPDHFAELTVREFEFPRSDAPDTLHFVGPVRPQPHPAPALPSWWSELDAGRPVVVLTQGTIANQNLDELIRPALRSLARRDVLVVAALGRDAAALAEVPGNVRAVDFFPFDQLLPRADVFVTNGGFGGVQQALAAGVPVVVCGVSEDKPGVAARAAYSGVGVNLQGDPSDDRVGTAVDTVLTDPGYRKAAEATAAAIAATDPVASIEALLTQA